MSHLLSRALRAAPVLAAVALGAVPAVASAGTLHVYAGVADNTLRAFDIGPSGALTANAVASTATTGVRFAGIVMTPDGAHLYAVSMITNTVVAFDVLPGGGLSPNAIPTIATGAAPSGIAISPDGDHVFVANSSSNTISIFDVSPSGALSAGSHGPVASAGGPTQIAVTRDGKHLYVTAIVGNGLRVFDIGAGGALTPNASPTASAPGLPEPIALTPDGGHAYVGQDGGLLTPFDVSPSGALTLNAMGALSIPGIQLVAMTVTPDSRHLLATAIGSVRELRVYDIDATGALTANSGGPLPTNDVARVALTPGGAHAYTADTGGTISAFDVGADGAIRVNGAPLAAPSGPGAIAVAPSQAPTAAFGAQTGAPGRATSFDASGSADRDGSVARYDWDFGDGTTLADGGPKPAHVYAGTGVYAVTVRLTDDQGCSGALTWGGQMARCAAGTQSVAAATVEVREPTPAPAPGAAPGAAPGSEPVLPLVTSADGATKLTDRGAILTIPGLKAVCTNGAGPCDDTRFAINATVQGRRVTLGRRALRLADGAESPVALKLSAWGRRSLARHRLMHVTAEAVVRNSQTGAQGVYVKNITLAVAKKKTTARRSRG